MEVVLAILALYAGVFVTWFTVHGGSHSRRAATNRKPLAATTEVKPNETPLAIPSRRGWAPSSTSLVYRYGRRT